MILHKYVHCMQYLSQVCNVHNIFVCIQALATLSVKEARAYQQAGSVAEEVLSAIRTVVAFGGEEWEQKRSVV